MAARGIAKLLAVAAIVTVPRVASAQDIVGKVIAGYQGWFSVEGDGSPVGSQPNGRGNAHLNLESYPDMREFPSSEQFPAPAEWNKLPNSNPATLFASDRDFTVRLHVAWMKEYGIDCAAIQRFGEVSSSKTTVYRDQKDEVTLRLMRACEQYGEKFYIEYDASASAKGFWGADWTATIEDDWQKFAVTQHVTSSSAYARENGKPVVELWGMGLNANNIAQDPSQWMSLVEWFKAHGCYVIGGVPTGWLDDSNFHDDLPGFGAVYASCDAISPWVVGRFRGTDGADSYAANNEAPELAWCAQHGITYIPCVYPGTSFHNSNGGMKNVIPRLGGMLMWQQFANLRKLGIKNCFISMFDEYNEATAIAKSAENANFTPAGQWFLWMDADGVAVSSDFYLRLTSDGARMIKGNAPLSWTLPTPPRSDLFTTGFEQNDPAPTWADLPDFAYNKSPMHVAGPSGAGGPICSVRCGGPAQSGTSSLFYAGVADGGKRTYCYYKLYDLSQSPREVTKGSLLYYWIYPLQDNGRYIGLDIQFTDGSTLGSSRCVDQNGFPLNASAGHGGAIPLNAWSIVTSRIGNLAGKKIAKIWVVFDRPGAVGPYSGYIDDIRISY